MQLFYWSILIYLIVFNFQEVLSSKTGALSRISFHHSPTYEYHDVVLTLSRFLRTKKDLNKFKFKKEEFISRIVLINSGEENGREADAKFLSYGTV